ncbi:L-Ala-D/L-Glu epimerase [Serratia fonticola]|uniref:L-Ala-D/L-Glu epimerase n=1 Tax=Serratia fonticola TaxID=47917 RepID=A0A4U9WJL7_SERFO|nr:L-Ala-D/L-Glu epimerase [Serratia fonticola]
MRSMRFYPEAWPLHTAFVIARGSRTEAKVVVVEIEQQGMRGVGECTPYPRYGESETSVMEQLAEVSTAIAQGVTRQELQHLMPRGRLVTRSIRHCGIWNAALLAKICGN